MNVMEGNTNVAEDATPWGFLLSLDVAGCDIDKITDPENVKNFSNTLVERIDMEKFGEPYVVLFGTGNKRGLTLVQLITTSNICAHFNETDGSLYFDCFSCKPFSNETVKQTVVEFFGAKSIKEHFIIRQA